MEELLAYIIDNSAVALSLGLILLLLAAVSIYKKSQQTTITYEDDIDLEEKPYNTPKDISSPKTTSENTDNGEMILKVFNNIAVFVMSVILYVVGFRFFTRNNSPIVAFAICYGVIYCIYNFIIKPSMFRKR